MKTYLIGFLSIFAASYALAGACGSPPYIISSACPGNTITTSDTSVWLRKTKYAADSSATLASLAGKASTAQHQSDSTTAANALTKSKYATDSSATASALSGKASTSQHVADSTLGANALTKSKYSTDSTTTASTVNGKAPLVSPAFTTPNLGTPSAVVLTNATGTAANLTAGTVTTNANLTGPITSSGNATSFGYSYAGTASNAMSSSATDTKLLIDVMANVSTQSGTKNSATMHTGKVIP